MDVDDPQERQLKNPIRRGTVGRRVNGSSCHPAVILWFEIRFSEGGGLESCRMRVKDVIRLKNRGRWWEREKRKNRRVTQSNIRENLWKIPWRN